MSSTGTTILISICLLLGGAAIVTGRDPPRNAATSSGGRTVADSPIRWAAPARGEALAGEDGPPELPVIVPSGAGPQRVEAFQRERQVRAPLVARQRVHLVHDDRVHAAQGVAGPGGQDEEQRLRGGDEDVRRLAGQAPALVRRRVAGADRHADVGLGQPAPPRHLADPGQRGAQVPLDVHRQRLERGDVEHPAAQLRVGGSRVARQPVQRPQEGGQRLARSRRRDDQRVVAGGDRRPGLGLGRGRLAERPGEPVAGERAEAAQRVRPAGMCRCPRARSRPPGAAGVSRDVGRRAGTYPSCLLPPTVWTVSPGAGRRAGTRRRP